MSENKITVLLVEDDPGFVRHVQELLGRVGGMTLRVAAVDRLEAALVWLDETPADVVMLAATLPGIPAGEGVKQMRGAFPHIPLIVVSKADDEAASLEAMHLGAQDWLVKRELTPHLLKRAIRYSIERQQTENAVLIAEEKYRAIFDNINEGIFQTTPDGRYLLANSALARIYGYDSPEQLMAEITDVGQKLYVDEGRRDDFIRLMRERGTVSGFESRVRRKDGRVIWISETVRAVCGDQGRLEYFEGAVTDITAHKLAEDALRDSEALYHSLVENLPQNIFRKDMSERFTFVNQQFCRTLGKPLNEIVGRDDYDFFPPNLAAKYQEDDRRVIASGKLFETVEEHQPPGGAKLYVHVVKTPLHDAHGRIIGVQGIFWDITEQKRAAEEVARANAELARSREALQLRNREMEEDLQMAREVQQMMLPQQYPVFPTGVSPGESRLRFCHCYYPTGTVGGDFFNVFSLSDTEAGVFICDVMGHGVRAALITAMIRALVEELKPLSGDPGRLLGKLNHDLFSILRHPDSPLLTTAFYLVADWKTGRMRYANAGHPKPLVIRRGAGTVELAANADDKSHPALGLYAEVNYPTSQRDLAPGDVVMLFTDGLYEVEGPGDTFYTQDRLVDAVLKRLHLPVDGLFSELVEEIQRFAAQREFADDVCIVGVEVCRQLES